jgi:hypothetical protein
MQLKDYIFRTLNANKSHDRIPRIVDWYNDCGYFSEICKCDGCGRYEDEDDTYSVTSNRRASVLLCPSCYDDAQVCADCNDGFTEDYYRGGWDNNGNFVCESCTDNYFTCEDCDETCANDDWNDDTSTCDSCAQSARNRIPDYHKQDRFSDPGNCRALFGVELEVYVKDTDRLMDVYEEVKDARFIGERDGSLDLDHGLEIVGPPISFEDNKTRWLNLLGRIRPYCQGWDAGTEYGMHVSLNRPSMGKLHQGKLLVFFHHNKHLCEVVAGRKEVHWAKYHRKSLSHARLHESDKYEAIALRSRTRAEVRIFRSTLKPEGFLRNLEFVAAAVEYTQTCSVSMLDAFNFRYWLHQPANRKSYPNLYNALNPNYQTTRTGRKMMYEAKRDRLSLEASLAGVIPEPDLCEFIYTPEYEQI